MKLLTHDSIYKISNEYLNLGLTEDQVKSIRNINSYQNNIILQYRQTGISSILDIYLTLFLINNPNTNTLVLNNKRNNNLIRLKRIENNLNQLAEHNFKIKYNGIFNKKDNSGLRFASPKEQVRGIRFDQIVYDNVNYYDKSIQDLMSSIKPALSDNYKSIFVTDNIYLNNNVEHLLNNCYVTVVTDSVK